MPTKAQQGLIPKHRGLIMIVREPMELAYLREETRREQQADQMEESWGFDRLELENMAKRWGTRQLLIALTEIHHQLTPDGSKVEWRILSRAYLIGGYDDPNPCHCDEF
jgi:hypothetical protein